MPKLTAKKKTIILAVALAALIAGGVHVLMSAGKESTDDAQIDAHIVAISPKVPGYVAAVNIVDNQVVKAGDVLIKIDPTDYQIRLDQAHANLEAAQARASVGQHNFASTSVTAPSDVDSARAQARVAQAALDIATADLKRYQSMSDLARSKKQLDDAVANEKQARAQVAYAQSRLRSAQTAPKAVAAAEATVRELEAAVKKAEADVSDAETQLHDTELTAPFDGRITRKNVEQGAYVQAGESLAAVVSSEYWIVANFKETQLTHMKPGQEVSIKVDAYPGKTYRGKVDSIQNGTGARFSAFPPENATGNFVKIVQRVPVKIVFDERPDPALAIGPGMSVVPTVSTR